MELYYLLQVALLFLLSVVLGRLSGPVIVKILEFFAGKTQSTLDDRVIEAVKNPLESCFFILVFYLLLNSFPDLSEAAKFLENYTYAIIVVLATYMLSEASGAAIRWYYEEGHKAARHVKVDLSLLPLLRKITKIAIYAIGLTIALSTLGFDVTGLLAVTSVVGIILGLASQETLGNFFAGIALQLDRPYHYGDFLRLPTGEVARLEKIGTRTTKMSDLSHNSIIISNSEFAKLKIVNLSLPDDSGIIFVQAELPLSADRAKLKKGIVARLAKEKPDGLLPEKGYSLSVDSVKPSSVAVSFTFGVKDYANAAKIKGIVNGVLLEFARKKK